MKTFASFSFVAGTFVGLSAWASGVPLASASPERARLSCQNSNTADVLTPRQMVDRAIAQNPCPEQSRLDDRYKHCESYAKAVQEAGEAWLREHKRSCDLHARFADIKANGCGNNTSPRDCQDRAQKMTEEGAQYARSESLAIDEFQRRLKDLREQLIQIAEGAVHLQAETTNAPPAARPGSVDFFRRGYQNAGQAMQYFNGQTLESATALIRAIRGTGGQSSRVTPEHVMSARYDLLQEPLLFASVADEFDRQLTERQRTLQTRGGELGRQSTLAQSNATGLGNVNAQQVGAIGAAAMPAAAALASGAGGGGQRSPASSGGVDPGSSALVWQREDSDSGSGLVQRSVPRASLLASNGDVAGGASVGGPVVQGREAPPALLSASAGAVVGDAKGPQRKGASSRSRGFPATSSSASHSERESVGAVSNYPGSSSKSASVGGVGPDANDSVSSPKVGLESVPFDAIEGGLSDGTFSMKGSETDSVVKQLTDSFSEELGLGKSHIQSAEKDATILGEDSAGLFKRNSLALKNALKSGRLTAVTPK